MNAVPLPRIAIISRNDEELNRSIVAKAVSIGRGLAEEWGQQMLLLVRAVVEITPPNTGAAGRGRKGLEAGKGAVNRDLSLMGFVPVEIKGSRTISHVPAGNVKGRPAVAITPVKVKTKENPKFADPDAFHHQRLQRKREMNRSRVSQGGKQAFYVSRKKYTAMRTRLYSELGKLAAAWIGIARRLNNGELPAWIPSWIRRHEAWGDAHTTFQVNLDPKQNKMFIFAVNRFPETADPKIVEDTQRRIEAAKGYRINAIRNGLEGRAKRIAAEKHAA